MNGILILQKLCAYYFPRSTFWETFNLLMVNYDKVKKKYALLHEFTIRLFYNFDKIKLFTTY